MSLLDLVPRPLRSRWPLRRFFWQQAEIDEIHARAEQIAKDLGWDHFPRETGGTGGAKET